MSIPGLMRSCALSLTLVGGSTLAGSCSLITTFDRSRIQDGGSDGGAGTDGNSMPTGPSLVLPTQGQVFPATRAFVSWEEGVAPSGLSVEGYELCSTTGEASTIDEESECPNSTVIDPTYAVLDPLVPNSTYRMKVRTRLSDGSVSFFSALRSFDVHDLLRARYLLNGNVADALGAHNGTVQGGVSFSAGLIDQCALFDGANSLVSVPNSPVLNFGTGDFTIAAWIRPSATGTNQAIMDKRGMTGGLYEFYRSADGSIAYSATGCTSTVSGGMAEEGVWRHALVTRSGGTVRLYVDGAEVDSGSCAGDLTNTGSLAIGCLSPETSCTEPFPGAIDEVLLISAASAAEVALNEFCAAQATAGVDPLPPACNP